MKTKLLFIKRILEDENKLFQDILEDLMEFSNDPWTKIVKTYMRDLRIYLHDLEQTKEQINI